MPLPHTPIDEPLVLATVLFAPVVFVAPVLPTAFVDVTLALVVPAPPAPPNESAAPVAQPFAAPSTRRTLATPSADKPT